ncbi:IS3 family transposase [Lentibacillus halophilus]|uniref:IS3 family transposase n=1 Tax=Lentibacillus halophilus TaxID=295065 RepID=A0ABN0Z0V3_9BACI
MIDQLRSEAYPINALCEALGVSRSGYYAYLKRSNKDANAEELISYIYHQYKGVLGVRGIESRLRQDYCWDINHKKVHRIMKKLGLTAVIRRKNHKKKYHQSPTGRVYHNLLNRDFEARKPFEKLVTDITEFKAGNQTIYLSVIMDLFNNEIIAHQASQEHDIKLVENTMKKAFKKKGTHTDTILHSDQGMQYRSNRYHQLTKTYNLTPSMSRKGTCLDNACAEGFFSHFKSEAFILFPFQSVQSAYRSISKYIAYYNKQRYQKRLHRLSPSQYLQWMAA